MAGPYNFNSQWKSARNLVLSPNAQAVWNTALASDLLTRRQRFDGSAVLELAQTRRSDIDYAGKGTAFATDGQVTMWDTKFSGWKSELSAYLAGWAFAFLMGTDTVTGEASPYTHAFAFDETTRTAVPTTIFLQDTDDVEYSCPDMCVNDVTLTINDLGAISVEITMMGTGRQIIGTMGTLPDLPTDAYLLNSDVTPTFGPVGDTAAFTGRVMSATLKFENQLVVNRGMGAGLYATFVRKGNPKFSFTATIAAQETDDIYTLFENDTASALSFAGDSGAAAQISVTYPAVHLKSTKLGFDGDMVVWQLEGDETTCFDLAGVPPVSVQVINAVASYLTTD
jgi:Phage tail tube protein